jgi:murein L,D-transpeptidase YafK
MIKVITLIMVFLSWDATAILPYYYQNYPYYSNISLVEKSKFEIQTYSFSEDKFKPIFKTKIATGKNPGNKLKEGDEKTPEGIYFTQTFADKKELQKDYGMLANIYGSGAWTLNYPNAVDSKIYKKTGTGIWIHGTDNPKRIDEQYSSRGCVVLKNEDFVEFSNINSKPHPVLITQNLENLTPEEVQNILSFLKRWKTNWELKNNNYFDSYHTEYVDLKYKKKLFLQRHDIAVSLDNVNILKHPEYYQVDFVQNYKDSHISDIGFKTLYLAKKDNRFQILEEQWINLKVIDKTAKKE